MKNIGYSVSNIINLGRKIQSVAADGQQNAEVYELATQLLLEAVEIRELIKDEAADKTIKDIIARANNHD
jgi:hypothetical protein